MGSLLMFEQQDELLKVHLWKKILQPISNPSRIPRRGRRCLSDHNSLWGIQIPDHPLHTRHPVFCRTQPSGPLCLWQCLCMRRNQTCQKLFRFCEPWTSYLMIERKVLLNCAKGYNFPRYVARSKLCCSCQFFLLRWLCQPPLTPDQRRSEQ